MSVKIKIQNTLNVQERYSLITIGAYFGFIRAFRLIYDLRPIMKESIKGYIQYYGISKN